MLSLDDISADLGGHGLGASSARRTIRSRRTARHHERDRAQPGSNPSSARLERTGRASWLLFWRALLRECQPALHGLRGADGGDRRKFDVTPKWGLPGSGRLRKSFESCQAGHAEIRLISTRSKHVVGGHVTFIQTQLLPYAPAARRRSAITLKGNIS